MMPKSFSANKFDTSTNNLNSRLANQNTNDKKSSQVDVHRVFSSSKFGSTELKQNPYF